MTAYIYKVSLGLAAKGYPLDIQIYLPDTCKSPWREFRAFLQAMSNRYGQGHFRWGIPNKRYKYMDRAFKELETYRRTGNIENLINTANYCMLEAQCPQNPKQHFNAYAKSATRKDTK